MLQEGLPWGYEGPCLTCYLLGEVGLEQRGLGGADLELMTPHSRGAGVEQEEGVEG